MLKPIQSKPIKNIVKILLAIFSIGLVFVLYKEVNTAKIYDSIRLLGSSQSLILYIILAVLSLFARAERFLIINKNDLDRNIYRMRPLILAGTSIRNLSMSVIPFRLGELSIPLLLRLKTPTEQISKNIHPIWISIIFDLAALLVLALFFGTTILFTEFKEFSISGFIIGYFEYSVILVFISILIFILMMIPIIPKKIVEGNRFHILQKKIPLIKLSSNEILEQIPTLSFFRSLRILTLSLLLRISKYISLAFLFYSLNDSLLPNFTNTLFIIASFISAELFSSLPGSGVMGFGGYELIFSICIKFFNPSLSETINSITAIHLLGFVVEILLGIVIIPLCILITKSYNFSQKL